MSRAPQPSCVKLPDCTPPYPALLDFLEQRFPKIPRDVWQARIEAGNVTDETGQPVTLATPYRPLTRVYYYRESAEERPIPFEERIVFQNDHLLVVCKPHFLPVTPSGQFINETLLYRLRRATGIDDLVPIHRLDRETAGLVLFSTQKATRGLYVTLFTTRQVKKIYEAIATLPADPSPGEWMLQSRMEPGDPWYIMRNVEGPANTITKVILLDRNERYGYYRLEPFTGRQHQLRLHMTLLGCQILNDRLYPVLQEHSRYDFSAPLQLLAKQLSFLDPVTQQPMSFVSTRTLLWEQTMP